MAREPICSVSLSLSRVFHLFCSDSLCVSPLSLYYVFHHSVPFSPLILMCFTIFSWCVSPSSLRFKRVEGGLWYPRLSTHGACSCYTTQLPSFYIAFAINLQSPIPWISWFPGCNWQLFTPQLCECHVLSTQTFKKMRNTLENYTLGNYTWLVCEIFLRHKRERDWRWSRKYMTSCGSRTLHEGWQLPTQSKTFQPTNLWTTAVKPLVMYICY